MAEFLSLQDAVSRHISNGDTVCMEGFTHLIPFAAGHEIIRQEKRDLTLIRMTPDLIYDQMIGAGCAKKLIFSWGGNPGVGSLHRLRDAVEKAWPNKLEILEHSHAAMACAYEAGAAGLPFAALRGSVGSDLPKVNDQITVANPSPQPQSQFYEVKSGDTLSKIAKQFYGDANKYSAIFEANQPMLKDPDEIYPGQTLRIPQQH